MSEIAKTILAQLGGNRFCAMTGAKNFVAGSRSLRFNVGRNEERVNIVTVELTARDTYDVKFMRSRGLDVAIVSEAEDVYADMLRPVFTDGTGMRCAL